MKKPIYTWLTAFIFAFTFFSGSALANTSPTSALSLAALDSLLNNSDDDELLEPEAAFAIQAGYDGENTVVAYWKIAKKYYMYRDRITAKILSGDANGVLTTRSGLMKDDPAFGEVEVYYDETYATFDLSKVSGDFSIEFGFQGCAELGVCYSPMKEKFNFTKGVAVEIPGVDLAKATNNQATTNTGATTELSEADQITSTLQNSSMWVVVLTFFVFGLLLAFTPCVFPMIPILSSIIVGQGGPNLSTRRAFTMSLVFVLAMAVTYTFAGVLAGLFGQNLQAAFQNPWIIGTFAAIFVALALSMFGFFELQLPSSLQSKITVLSNKQEGGKLTGVAVMGFLSALIVGPCVAPPLAGALIYIGQTGDALLGGLALFAMSIGMGMPLLLLGTSAGKLLPRAGGWMETVKAVFGVMLIGVAIWMAGRIMPDVVTLSLWAGLFIITAIYMGALEPIGEKSSWHKLWKGLGIGLLVYGVILVIGIAGGSRDLMQPLKVFQGGGSGAAAEQGLKFERVANLEELKARLGKGDKVMLDFYADWCVSCHEMEKQTFTDPSVQAALQGVTLLQVDVTANSKDDKELMAEFGLFGPPAIMFFDAQGNEQKPQRVVGFKNAQDFTGFINRAFKQ